MKIIIPMAGMGKRMRPHTLTIPKPLIKIAGKHIVQRLVEDISLVCEEKVDEIAFVIGDFGKKVENELINIAKNVGSKATIYYQYEALGTAHAILCAKESLKGKVVVAFADTLFRAEFKLDAAQDGIIWVHKVKDPSSFGVVKTNEKNIITDFIEKPKEFISENAIIGIYYFKDGDYLCKQLQYLIDNNVQKGGEYQLTDALENMKKAGTKFTIGNVEEWLDCGNKNATVYTNQRILATNNNEDLVSKSAIIINSIIIKPCFIGNNAKIENSVVGPYVSIGDYTSIDNSVISNSIIQNNTKLSCVNIDNSMIGNNVEYKGIMNDVSIGDYTTLN